MCNSAHIREIAWTVAPLCGWKYFSAALTLLVGHRVDRYRSYFKGDPVFQPRSPASRKEAARETISRGRI